MNFDSLKNALRYFCTYQINLEGIRMPFKSKAQEKWMFANKPEMAKEWANETPDIKKLPTKVKKKKTKTKTKTKRK